MNEVGRGQKADDPPGVMSLND
ncbi:hypothetical protein SPHINGO8AM_30516 [Sphingomonas sp. 8AM]|nr:hypothetical protein SPHINGO8AM_30516 [Sphingomonas sp. 8AM]